MSQTIQTQRPDGSPGVEMPTEVYERRKEAVKDIFMLWSKVSVKELAQHLQDHPGVQDDPALWLMDILDDLVVRKVLREEDGVYSMA
ncbi:MAG TPA: hypothetical protein ENJ88_10055 [Phaeodactylibacter sp.]|nr:hypothetical protein [Phaeodactylibacter sp.]